MEPVKDVIQNRPDIGAVELQKMQFEIMALMNKYGFEFCPQEPVDLAGLDSPIKKRISTGLNLKDTGFDQYYIAVARVVEKEPDGTPSKTALYGFGQLTGSAKVQIAARLMDVPVDIIEMFMLANGGRTLEGE